MLCYSPVWEMALLPMSFWLSLFGVDQTTRTAWGFSSQRNRVSRRRRKNRKSRKLPPDVVSFCSRRTCKTITAATVAKSIRRGTRQEDEFGENRFRPRPSPFACRAGLRSDDDIWIECFHVTNVNQRRYFYRSYNTGECLLSEPPSGARTVVYQRDLKNAPQEIRRFATELLSQDAVADLNKQQLRQIPAARTTHRLWNRIVRIKARRIRLTGRAIVSA